MKIKLTNFLFLSLIIIACQGDYIFKDSYSFKNYTWSKNEDLVFNVEITPDQCKNQYNLIFGIRYINGFSLKYLNFTLEIHRPNGSQATKDLSIQIVSDDKKYRGEGMGDIWDLDYKMSDDLEFEDPGNYQFILKPIPGEVPVYFINKISIRLMKKEIS